MSGLLDIAPLSKKVAISNGTVDVYGISVGGIASLMGRFSALQALFNGKEIDAGALLPLGNEIVAAIIAAGCGNIGHPTAEMIAQQLPFGDQVDLLTAIVGMTMPGGVGPLIEKLSGLGASLNVKPVPAATTPSPGDQTSQTTSPNPLNGSSHPVTTQATFGATPPSV